MATERELRTIQEDRLFDLLMLMSANDAKRFELLKNQIARAESGMTVEEIAHVKERVTRANE